MSLERLQKEPSLVNSERWHPIDVLIKMGLIGHENPFAKNPDSYPFSWINLATTGHFNVGNKSIPAPNPTIGNVFNTAMEVGAKIVRTGHFGGRWSEIIRGSGNRLIFNLVHLLLGLGPVVQYDFNHCAGQNRDDSYQPHIIYDDNGTPTELEILTWDGKGFSQANQEGPGILTPFAMTIYNGEMVPLVKVHQRTLREMSDRFGPENVATFSEIIINERGNFMDFIINYLTYYANLGNNEEEVNEANKALRLLVNRSVATNGIVTNDKSNNPLLSVNGSGKICLALGDSGYKEYTPDDIASLMMVPFELATNPDLLYNIGELDGNVFPFLSLDAVIAIFALLNGYSGDGIQIHMHGGAFDMAGTPTRRGYFESHTNSVRSFLSFAQRAITQREINGAKDESWQLPNTLSYVLVPSAVLLLYPRADSNDTELVYELITAVYEACKNVPGRSYEEKRSNEMRIIEGIVSNWLNNRGEELSEEFRSRFNPRLRNPLRDESLSYVPPPELDKLTFRQAMTVIDSLTNNFN